MTVTGGAVDRLLDGASDEPASPLRYDTLSDIGMVRDVMTDVGRAAEVNKVVVCNDPGQAAVVYIGAMIQEFELPSAT
jgi:hypothetical protein